jgi:hypothetical protein
MVRLSSLSGAQRELDNFLSNIIVEMYLQKHRQQKESRDFGHSRRRTRMVWENRVASLTPQEFKRTYRMSLKTFNFVLERIRRRITSKAPKKARRDTHGAVPAELLLSMTLRFLAGGSYLDIYQMHGVGKSTLYHAIPMVSHAIATEFPLSFPIDDEDALVSSTVLVDTGLVAHCFCAVCAYDSIYLPSASIAPRMPHIHTP